MSGNDLRGTPEADHWSIYGRLPEAFRRLLQLAHTNYKAGWVIDLYLIHGPQGGYDAVRKRLWDLRRRDIREAYGPTHPELQR